MSVHFGNVCCLHILQRKRRENDCRNPVYQSVGDLVGIGHSAMFTDKEGKLRIVFHSHYSKTSIHPRIMHISTVNFVEENGKEVMRIDPDYFTPGRGN
jgi:hypothetical protein